MDIQEPKGKTSKRKCLYCAQAGGKRNNNIALCLRKQPLMIACLREERLRGMLRNLKKELVLADDRDCPQVERRYEYSYHTILTGSGNVPLVHKPASKQF